MKRRALILFLVTFTLVATAACGGGPSEAGATATPPGTKPREITIMAMYPEFDPSTITIAKGQAVKLSVMSHDMGHTFTIDELGINITVGGGQTVTKEIKVDQAGTYTFYCAIPGHRDAGMKGTLKVSE